MLAKNVGTTRSFRNECVILNDHREQARSYSGSACQRAVIFQARWILALRAKSGSMVWAVISSTA